MSQAVALIQINDQQVPQEQWAKLNFKEINKYGNTLIKTYPVSYQYEIEKALGNILSENSGTRTIKRYCSTASEKEILTMLSLEKVDGSIIKALAAANPQARTVDFYDPKTQQKILDIKEFKAF